MTFPEVTLLGMKVAVTSSAALLDHLFQSLDEGRGGWVVTANLDILRRFVLDSDARGAYEAADLRVADGMPLVWASQLLGEPLPERIAGSTLTSAIAARAAETGRTLYLLGGDEGAAEGTARSFQARWPSLTILGTSRPWVSSPATTEEIDAIAAEIGSVAPDLILVGLGSPKQEYVIQKLKQRFPATWLMGVGISFGFVAGQVKRAPEWMQRAGAEWIHRMAQDPQRLVRRYLIDDLPFAALLFGDALRRRRR
ncbi:MAG: WecB/TagA/CpsF family glycosyltransferase [Myxococcota bacterium]